MSSPNVYIVDDDDAVRDSLTVLLTAHGFTASSFASGPEFLKAVPDLAGGCLIVDLQMPDMTGLELQRRLAELNIRLPLVMITAFGDIATAVKAMRAGAADFVEKPFSDISIIDGIEHAMSAASAEAETDRLREQVAERMKLLSRREREVMEWIVAGDPNKVIAYKLGLSPRTVEIHRARVMDKMQARNV
jgi:two-component system response regulator FixJ